MEKDIHDIVRRDYANIALEKKEDQRLSYMRSVQKNGIKYIASKILKKI